jgi:hypothetical protein
LKYRITNCKKESFSDPPPKLISNENCVQRYIYMFNEVEFNCTAILRNTSSILFYVKSTKVFVV